MTLKLPDARVVSFKDVEKDFKNPPILETLLPDEILNAVKGLPEEYRDLTEEQLEDKFPRPDATLLQLRMMLWREYDRAMELRHKMDFGRIHMGICTKATFLKFLVKVKNLAWLVTPPKQYLIEVEEMGRAALRQMREIINLPINEDGVVNVKLGELKLKVMMALDMRLNGGYLHRSMQVTQNLNRTEMVTFNSKPTEYPKQDKLSIDEQIIHLEAEIAKMEADQRRRALEAQEEVPGIRQKNVLERVADNSDMVDAEYREVSKGSG